MKPAPKPCQPLGVYGKTGRQVNPPQQARFNPEQLKSCAPAGLWPVGKTSLASQCLRLHRQNAETGRTPRSGADQGDAPPSILTLASASGLPPQSKGVECSIVGELPGAASW